MHPHDEMPPLRCLHPSRTRGFFGTERLCGKPMTKDLVICRKRDCRFVKTIDGTHFHRQCQDGHVDYRFAIVD